MDLIKRCWAEISFDALRSNLEIIKKSVKTDVLCVIKANAYGHGDVPVARELERLGVSHFAVASADEAAHLRESGVTGELVVLGACLDDCFDCAAEYDVSLAVCDPGFARRLSAFAQSKGKRMKVHIKLNTGMSRVGIDCLRPEDAPKTAGIIKDIAALPALDIRGVFTHFCVSDEADGASFTDLQYKNFISVRRELDKMGVSVGKWHCANSGAIINRPDLALDMVRAGIVLYGCYDGFGKPNGFTPLMSLKTVITQLRDIPAGTSVSYGRTYVSETPRKTAVISIGYGDGYPRSLSNKGSVIVCGKRAPIIGRVCMDQTIIDVTGIDCKVGDLVTVLGDGITVTELADVDGTIGYEILCGIAQRVPRLYYRGGECVEVLKYL